MDTETSLKPLGWPSLPLHALRLLISHALPLVMVFAIGRLVRWSLLWTAATVSHGSWYQARLVLVTFLFTLVVMVSLATTAVMLHVLRAGLRETRMRRAEGGTDESLLNSLNRTALIFAGIYLTWGQVKEDVSDFGNIDVLREIGNLFVPEILGEENTVFQGLIALDVKISLAAMAVAWPLKIWLARRHEAGKGRFSGILTTFAELAFAFYGLNALFAFSGSRAEWIGSRVAVGWWQDLMKSTGDIVPGWNTLWAFVGEHIWPFVSDALVMPLMWLTVAILIYGAYAEDTRTTIRGTRLDAVAERVERTHDYTRTLLARLTGGFTSRWVPLLNSLRLTMKAGAPLFGLFVLLYALLRIGGDYLARGLRYLVDTGEPYVWIITGEPIVFVTELVVTVLTMCLLAATFDIAATRGRLAPSDQEADSDTGSERSAPQEA